MKYHDLVTTKKKTGKRVGRGIAAGQGKTAGRGTKGQNSRTGSSRKPGFEGGQNPLMQRLPKLRGFKSKKPEVENVFTGQLEVLGKKIVDSTVLAEAGFLSNPYVKIKLIVKGDLTKAVTVKLPSASAGAIAVVEAAGGSFEVRAQVGRPVTRTPKKSNIAK